LERRAPPRFASYKIETDLASQERPNDTPGVESAKLDRPPRLFRSLRRSRLLSQRMNGRSLQRIISMSLKARRRSSIWALRVQTSRSAADGTTKRLTES
jgi:hypothetical protein